ncbi:MAG: hypothetical protein A2Y40_05305 [Candidatus Margulisbacteria bacterium GWF2_35_9]|nr:MAG: hypothetical protein A2Y40_05305 [Candidatus Margulisbacteria bacterium GWF2_35_9]
MRILFLTPEYVTEKYFDGGLANYIYRIAKELSKNYHVEIIVSSDQTEIIKHDGLEVYRVGLKAYEKIVMSFINFLTRGKIAPTLKYIFYSRRMYKFYKMLEPFDVIQSSNYGFPGYFIFKKEKRPLIKKIARASSYAPAWRSATGDGNNFNEVLNNYLEVRLMRSADKCYSPSQFVQQLYLMNESLKLDVIRTPIAEKEVETDSSVYDEKLGHIGKYVLYFGSISVSKGLDQLGDILPDIIEKNPDIKVVLVGKVALKSANEDLVEYLKNKISKFETHVIYLEKLKHNQLYPIIDHAHGVFFLSRVDNIPNACLEAISMDKLILAPNSASFNEMLSEKNAMLYKQADMNDLKDCFEKFWTMNDREKKKVVDQLTINSNEYKMNTVISKLESYYKGDF